MKENNKTRKRRNFKGGKISLNNLKSVRNINISDYYPLAKIIGDVFIPDVLINGKKCSGDEASLEVTGRGASGFTLRFSCTDEKKYAIKILFNSAFRNSYIKNFNVFKSKVLDDLVKEYEENKRFDNEYIMKAYNYFLFDGNKFTVVSDVGIQTISMDESLRQINNYKQTSFDPLSPFRSGTPEWYDWIKQNKTVRNKWRANHKASFEIPMFAGLCLESIEKNSDDFTELNKDLQTVEMTIDFFIQIFKGLDYLSSNGYIHGDMKLPNTMYNVDADNKIHVKIIDLGTVFKLATILDRKTNMVGTSPVAFSANNLKQIKNVEKRRNNQKTNTNDQGIVNELLTKYDVFGVCNSFIDHLSQIAPSQHEDPKFKSLVEIMKKGLPLDYKNRASIKDMIQLLSTLLRS